MRRSRVSKSEQAVPRGRRWRERIARFFHFLAFVLFLFVIEILVVGGVRFDVGGVSIATIHVKNPLIYALVLTALGKLVAPSIALRDVPTARFVRWLRGHARTIKQPRSALIVAFALLLTTYGAWRELHQRHHTTLAAQHEAQGRNDLAAERYAAANFGWLDPQRRPLREKRGYCEWRSGQFEKCAATLEGDFKAGRFMGRAGYRALWSCYRELGRLEEAADVVQIAMGTHSDLGKECTGVLAQLEREMAGTEAKTANVRFEYAAPEEREGPLYLIGSWTASGKQNEVHGWKPRELSTSDGGKTWTADVALAPPGEFPYSAVVVSDPKDRATPALAAAQFRLESGKGATVTLKPEGAHGRVPPAGKRKPGADGKKRVVALWPDAGSWFLVQAYVHRGLMPNVGALLARGARGEMMSTNPPFTSTAYLQMVELNPGGTTAAGGRVLDTLMIQLKGIPFLDALFPDDVVAGGGPTIFSVLASKGHTAVNLVFNDRFMSAPNDLTTNDGTTIKVDQKALADAKEERDVDGDTTQWILKDVLEVDAGAEPERAKAIEDEDVFLLGIENTEHKAVAGKKLWNEAKPDFMLLRFPSVDILSHKYFWSVEESPEQNLMVETYRHLDRIVGDFMAELDQDDTFILVSDHGISGTLHHHRSCLLVIDGPGIDPGSSFDTIPIGHLPPVVLSRFGIEDGSDRLTDDSFAFFYGRPRPGAAKVGSLPSEKEETL